MTRLPSPEQGEWCSPLLGLDRGDEVQLRIEKDKLIVERADEVATAEQRRAKLDKAKARMHANIGGTLRKLAR